MVFDGEAVKMKNLEFRFVIKARDTVGGFHRQNNLFYLLVEAIEHGLRSTPNDIKKDLAEATNHFVDTTN